LETFCSAPTLDTMSISKISVYTAISMMSHAE